MKLALAAAAIVLAAPFATAQVNISYTPDGTRVLTRPVVIEAIHTQADAERAYVQLQRVTKRACDHHGQSVQVFRIHAAARACQAEALDNAVVSLGNSRVTAIHEAR